MNNKSLVFYHLPNATNWTLLEQKDRPKEIYSLEEINNKTGFIIAPFYSDKHNHTILIEPDNIIDNIINNNIETTQYLDKSTNNAKLNIDLHKEKEIYTKTFQIFHQQLKNGNLKKIVLSRRLNIPIEKNINPKDIFIKACLTYPDQFVTLFDTPQTGMWLMATPETLLAGNGNRYKTMALAGTIHNNEEEKNITWSNKNKEEQQYVAQFIRQILKNNATEINETIPTTIKAGKLFHLCTEFKFKLKNSIGTLIEQLHPTPAVCGVPKDTALKFIIENEPTTREYYSGFVGPLNINNKTWLFVSLRCAKINNKACQLYAGGGLLLKSNLETEWEETQRKMETILNVIKNK